MFLTSIIFYLSFRTQNTDVNLIFTDNVYKSDVEQNQYRLSKTLC